MNMIEERTKKEERKFELVKDSSEFLHDLNTYFPKLMNYLWDQPKMISYIIQNARNRYVEEYLAPFFADNFYENILSSNYVEDNLMYILALLLESEINNLNDINQSESFLEKTPCGYLLSEIYPLSTKSIVSNTLSGGSNILIGSNNYTSLEKEILNKHNTESEQFNELLTASKDVHKEFKSVLGIICGFDYIYDENKKKWFLLEYHSIPMVGDYSKRQNIKYETSEDRITAEGRVRATALSLVLKKTR